MASVCNFIKKETMPQVFFCKFFKLFKNTFFMEHIRQTASGSSFVLSEI